MASLSHLDHVSSAIGSRLIVPAPAGLNGVQYIPTLAPTTKKGALMPADTTIPVELLTLDDIVTLNRARTILAVMEKDVRDLGVRALVGGYGVRPDALDCGVVAATAEAAAFALFQVLNALNAYRVQPLADDVLHNRV